MAIIAERIAQECGGMGVPLDAPLAPPNTSTDPDHPTYPETPPAPTRHSDRPSQADTSAERPTTEAASRRAALFDPERSISRRWSNNADGRTTLTVEQD